MGFLCFPLWFGALSFQPFHVVVMTTFAASLLKFPVLVLAKDHLLQPI